MSTARDEILRRTRVALRDVPSGERPDDVPVERGYQHDDPAPREEIVERFAERVAEYRATVRRVKRSGLPGAIASACAARGVRRLVVPADLPADWLSDGGMEGVEVLRDGGERQLSNAELEACDGALTGCALGIAQTGTIVLDDGPAQGRRAVTLLPDYHLCVVREEQVVGLVPEAITQLGEPLRAGRRPLTFISGPSATSDIELNRVEGVHGPRTLEVLLVAE
jgi:L-lactate dehydrogenase complex protein LldG